MRKLILVLLSGIAVAQVPCRTSGTVNTKGSVNVCVPVVGVALQSITVLPANFSSPLNSPIIYTALATYTDGSTGDITTQAVWSLNPAGIATNIINSVTCIATGTVSVQASLSGISGSTNLSCQSSQITPSGVLQNAIQNQPYSH